MSTYSIVWSVHDDALDRLWKEAVVAYFNTPSSHLPEESAANLEKGPTLGSFFFMAQQSLVSQGLFIIEA